MSKLISVEGDGHCCHRPSSNWETYYVEYYFGSSESRKTQLCYKTRQQSYYCLKMTWLKEYIGGKEYRSFLYSGKIMQFIREKNCGTQFCDLKQYKGKISLPEKFC